MNPNDVNRLNYNCFYIGSQLDTLVRSKMRSESFITPLKVTPKFYTDELSKKMKLLGQHGSYYPEEISPYTENYERQTPERTMIIPRNQPQGQQFPYQVVNQQHPYHISDQMPIQTPNPYQSQHSQHEIPQQQMPYLQQQQQQQHQTIDEEVNYAMKPKQSEYQIEKANNIEFNRNSNGNNQRNISHIQKYHQEIQQPHNEQLYRSEFPRDRHNFHYINQY